MSAAVFIGVLVVFLLIGLASAAKSQGTKADYYLASRGVAPWLAALSAVATNNSGYMFIGVIGFTYAAGLSAIWLMVGWIAGDFFASLFIHRQLRIYTERTSEATFGGVLSRWGGQNYRVLRKLAALLTIAFLGAYAAAQLSAGGKALHATFGWDIHVGAIAVAAVVAVYCLAGGIRASIWTDAAQSFVMMIAMALLVWVGFANLGGPVAVLHKLDAIPLYLDWFPSDLIVPGLFGPLLFVVGWLFAGFSVIGQPHIMVRFMALDDANHLKRARIYYYTYYIAFYALATCVGLLSRIYLPQLGGIDPELALPTMAGHLLPSALIGFVIAGIFAATMSTADSLILSCSAAVTHDLLPRNVEKSWEIKTATLLVTALALVIALTGNQSVFSLVIFAWSTLASAFGPLLVVYVLGRRVSEPVALAMMIVGPLVAFGWRMLGLQNEIYEGMPGILAGFVVYFIGSSISGAKPAQPQEKRDLA